MVEPLVVIWPRNVAEPRKAGHLYYKDTAARTKMDMVIAGACGQHRERPSRGGGHYAASGAE